MNAPHGDYTMQQRTDDDIATKVLRVVDWKWFLGLIIAVVGWAIGSWVNYNQLLSSVDTMSKGFTALTVEIKSISQELTNLKITDLKHEAELARLKDQVAEIQSWKQAKQNGTLK